MFTVYLDKNGMKKEKEITNYLDDQLLHNCNLSGDEYTIEENELTWIDIKDEYLGVPLLNGINDIVNNH